MPAKARTPIALTALLALVAMLWLSPTPSAVAAPAKPAQSGIALQGPVGWQSYRRLDLLPFVRAGVVTYQASSADPTGHNDDGYSGKYSCLRRVRLGCVMAQHAGPGELESVWTAGNQLAAAGASGDLIVQLDGRTVLDRTWLQLTSGRPVSPFAFPLALGPTESWHGWSIQVPMTFRRSMRVVSQYNPHYFHVVYKAFRTAVDLQSAGPATKDPGDVLSELRYAGTRDPKPSMGPGANVRRDFSLRPGHHAVLARIKGAGAITALRLSFKRYRLTGSATPRSAAADVYQHARLRISFDGARTVDSPIGEFFGSGLGPAKVRALMFAMDRTPTGSATSWWPMPFASTAVVEIDDASSTAVASGQLDLTWARSSAWGQRLGPGGHYGYFHAFGLLRWGLVLL